MICYNMNMKLLKVIKLKLNKIVLIIQNKIVIVKYFIKLNYQI